MKPEKITLADLDQFDEIIDVRSPAEFAEDHIPGAINCPVLDNQQRIEVGTLYKQTSAFEAKKIGAAMVAENIGKHLRAHFLDRPKSWKPLIYCWRGGNRSGSMTTVFRAIGWPAGQLAGGYKIYRSEVVSRLETLPLNFNFRVVCGATGSAKTRVLQAIGDLGEQILDLESLASHKGSVLGIMPGQPQPNQKWFETLLLQALNALDPARPVYVEAESRKVGNLHVPAALITRIRSGECLGVEATLPARVSFLLKDYAYFLADPSLFLNRIDALKALQSRETLDSWRNLANCGAWSQLVEELLEKHYDPLYHASQNRNFAAYRPLENFVTNDLSEAGIVALAERLLHARRAQIA
jgi:tRNA 2-selenouridine synthase